MPKMKTHRGAAKRLRKTGSGKLKRNKAYKSHILTHEEYIDYINNFYELLNELKKISYS